MLLLRHFKGVTTVWNEGNEVKNLSLFGWMNEDIIQPAATYGPNIADEKQLQDTGIEQLFESRTEILKTKLEVFASEISDRLRIRAHNLLAIEENQQRLAFLIADTTRQANYLLRDRRDVLSLQQIDSGLDKEKREQDTACWRDVAEVMKDFLEVWEALAQAKARSAFLRGYG